MYDQFEFRFVNNDKLTEIVDSNKMGLDYEFDFNLFVARDKIIHLSKLSVNCHGQDDNAVPCANTTFTSLLWQYDEDSSESLPNFIFYV